MRYFLTLLLLLPLGLDVASAADVKPLVINSTTGRTEQLKAGDRLTLPDASGDLIVIAPGVQTAARVLTLPVLTADTTVAVIGQGQTFTGVQTFGTPIASASGGTGVSNAGSITNASNTTITGGGTVALGGFTLTVPATGTAVLTTTAQSIAGVKTFTDTTSASTSLLGALVVGNGVAATSVGIGAGNINAGGTITAGTPIASASGGTGVSNAGSITNASNTTITGGGTVALGGFTLTVPATGTAVLTTTAQSIAGVKTFSDTTSASTSLLGAVVVGNGVAATSVGIGAGNINAGGTITAGGAVTTSSPTGGIGYRTGAGGAVTQITSKTTGVTLNTICGTITVASTSVPVNITTSFVFTNSAIAATDLVVISHDSVGTIGAYGFGSTPAAGSTTISIRNNNNSPLAEAIVLRFVVIKAVEN